MPRAKKTSQPSMKDSEQKWGKPLLDAGWTILPSTILEHQHALKLSPVELSILLQLLRHWWRVDELPFPAVKTIGKCIGKSESAVRRGIKNMKKNGLIEIEHRYTKQGGQASSWYSFDGLIDAATKLAREKLKERKRKSKRKKNGKATRKK